uniref:F-box domain-containing protein n=1 Tax=Strigamia maritima TaxID=126957 RepID=T1J548_STRMM
MGGFNWRDILMDSSSDSTRSSCSHLFTKLPPEVLAQIFSHLPGKDVCNVSKVCKAFFDASKVESIWQKRCRVEYGILLRDCQNGLSFMQLYTKILYKYGHMIGVWQTEVAAYGGLLQVKFEENKLVGIEWRPPSNPNLRDALRRRDLFTIELTEDGLLQILCQKGSHGPHPAAIEMKKKVCFYTKCCCPEKHEYLGSKEQEFFEWLKDETSVAHLLDVHLKELFLMKFLNIREYERNAFEHRRLRPSPPKADAIIQPGLFKGTYSSHGLELVLLTYDSYGTKVKVTKVTGDPNVPAGELTFKSDLQYPIILTENQQLDIQVMRQPDAVVSPIPLHKLPLQSFRLPAEFSPDDANIIPSTCKGRFYGWGQVAGHGFTNPSFIGGHWIIFNEDLFGFLWFELLSLSLYHRVQEDILSDHRTLIFMNQFLRNILSRHKTKPRNNQSRLVNAGHVRSENIFLVSVNDKNVTEIHTLTGNSKPLGVFLVLADVNEENLLLTERLDGIPHLKGKGDEDMASTFSGYGYEVD